MKWGNTISRLRPSRLSAGLGIVTTLCLGTLAFSGHAQADAIVLELATTSVSVASGATEIFQGTVTNNSGADLNASDFFLNFFGYNSTLVTPVQDLGLVSDFLIPQGTTSPLVDLFSVTTGPALDGTVFPLDVQLEDSSLDLSAPQRVTISIGSSASATPEPATLALACAGLAGFITLRSRTKHASILPSTVENQRNCIV